MQHQAPDLPKVGGKNRFKFLGLQHVLVPIDFSSSSEKALHYAAVLANHSMTNIVLLHVVEIYPIDYVFGLKTDQEQSDRLVAEAKLELTRLSRRYLWDRVQAVRTLVNLGKPYKEIVKVARETGVDLVIMGTHGHTGFRHLQLGSTAERVVRHSPCPVLVVRDQEHDFVELVPDKRMPSRTSNLRRNPVGFVSPINAS